MRVIDADALLERMMKDPLFPIVERYGVSGVIEAEPTVDAVEIVRCRDCIHKPYVVDVFHASYGDVPVLESNGKCPCINADDYFYSHMPDDDWFCANGERREADEH